MGQIKVTKASIEGLYVIESSIHGDDTLFLSSCLKNGLKIIVVC